MAKGKKGKGGKGMSTPAVYKIIEIVGTSTQSWADAGRNGVETASKSLRDLRVAEVITLDVKIDNGKLTYRAKMKVSFKYHGDD